MQARVRLSRTNEANLHGSSHVPALLCVCVFERNRLVCVQVFVCVFLKWVDWREYRSLCVCV